MRREMLGLFDERFDLGKEERDCVLWPELR